MAVLTALTPDDAIAHDAPVWDSAALQQMTTMPAGAAIGDASIFEDAHTGATWARWLWLGVLVLLGLEWWMRRHMVQRATARGDA